ncbi:MAG: SGNH/GDSL hydrolase family protein [Ferruginibacter sp.]
MSYSYLALGDSYTIGEGVLISESFSYQTVQLLRKNNSPFLAPEIVAKTGWTTDELQEAILKTTFLPQYDIVSLLIGVNNQYRGRDTSNFKIEFEDLLQRAILFAGNKANHVFVLSIPDWGITPFAQGRDRKKISEEINAYNAVCEASAKAFKTSFINIILTQKKDGYDESFVAADGLHPSAKEYAKWARVLDDEVNKILF